jgi:hypothetical protein
MAKARKKPSQKRSRKNGRNVKYIIVTLSGSMAWLGQFVEKTSRRKKISEAHVARIALSEHLAAIDDDCRKEFESWKRLMGVEEAK